MDRVGKREKRHVVCIPLPVQSHINAMLCVAKLLHQRGGFYITFVNTEYSHNRILKTRGPNALDGLPDFQFRTIPDGLPEYSAVDDDASTQDISALCASLSKNLVAPFRNLLSQLHDHDASSQNYIPPPVSFVVGDCSLAFTIHVAAEFSVPIAQFWPISACSALAFLHYRGLVDRGITPFKDESYFTNGYLDTIIDWIPGMKNIKLKDMPSFIRTTNPQDIFLNFFIEISMATPKASAIIINTFDSLEQNALKALSGFLPPIYTIGPIHLFEKQMKNESLGKIATNLWKEESGCIDWLNSKEPNSVIYVNYGSLAVVKPHHLTEFAWGLVNSGKPFLWIIRPDLVQDESAGLSLSSDLLLKVKENGMIASWCSQKEVLKHPSIGGFLTHSGWNSTIESICAGVPMISWPFIGDQQTNCRYCCVEWGIAMELDSDVKRNEVENLIKELMEGEKSEVMKRNIMELKSKAEEACKPGGSSYINIEKIINCCEILKGN